jgi:predicted nucleic acid-binding protein
LLAATALVHDLTLVSRDNALLTLDAIRSINPFEPS